MRTTRIYVVDRIEGSVAVLVTDDGQTSNVTLGQLPVRIREGTVLSVRVEDDGRPSWHDTVIDDRERVKREREAEGVLERLRKRDPGGDVAL